MIPYILAAVGAYFVGSSLTDKSKSKSEKALEEQIADARKRTREILAVPRRHRSYADGGKISTSDIGLTIYKDEDGVTIMGYPKQEKTIREFDSAYDFEDLVKKKIDCKGIDFDSEYAEFVAYTKTKERAVKFVKDIEDYFAKIKADLYKDGGLLESDGWMKDVEEDFSEETIETIKNYEKVIKTKVSGEQLKDHLIVIKYLKLGDFNEAFFHYRYFDENQKKMIPKDAIDLIEDGYDPSPID